MVESSLPSPPSDPGSGGPEPEATPTAGEPLNEAAASPQPPQAGSLPVETAEEAPETPAAPPEPATEPPASADAVSLPPGPAEAPPAAPPSETEPRPEPAAPPAGVAATLTVPPLEEGPGTGEGGEFALLLSRLSQWLEQQDLAGKWDQLRGPLRGLALLVAALVVLRLYGALLGTLAGLPLVPRLLQLVGLVAVLQFSVANLVRSHDRQQLMARWQQRWTAFRGQG